jgi:predicted Zn-dependent peptidase
MAALYAPDVLLISAAGNLEHSALVDMCAAQFGGMSGKKKALAPEPVVPAVDTALTHKSTEQVNFCIGTPGYSQISEEKYPLALADSILGGGMSSRLFQEIREKRGLVYAIGSYSASYMAAGMFAVYGGTSMENLDQVLQLVTDEFQSIRKDNVTDAELMRAKNQIRGALVLGQESMSNRMSRMAKSEFYFGRVIGLDEIIDSIMRVTKDDIARVSDRLFAGPQFALAAVGPFGRSRKKTGSAVPA